MGNTIEQNLAITTIDKNIAVNAGAGTGKTKVLTERYVYILENGDLEQNKEVESIVAITFTKKATQEMKERIREEIKKRFPLGKEWRRYYKDMEKSNISTIHSFCGNILRDNALAIGIDPLFQVLDDREGDIILEETILELLLKAIEEDDKVYDMVKIFNRDDLDKVVAEIKSIYYRVRTVGQSFKEAKTMTLSYIKNIQLDLKDIQFIKDSFIYLMEKSRKSSKINKLKSNDIWIRFINGEYREEELIPILEYLSSNIGTNSQEMDRIESLKSTINKVFLIKEKEYLWLYQAFLGLLVEVDKEYSKKKDELGVLDYDDLQILVLKLLEDESIRREYQEKFKYIMVDEFQDTNELQKKIFYLLCSKDEILDRNNLFIVGDPKQSIYGFRGADLQVFYDVVEDIERITDKKTIILDKNFRTVDTILTFVNSVFEKLMGNRYKKLKNHHISNNQIDVEFLEKKDLETPSNIGNSDYNTYVESRLIAGRIKDLVEEGAFDYGDFALLFRASTVDHIYEDGLKEYGVPYYNIGGKGFYQCQEIIDLINGLKAISNRYDTIPFLGFLRSPMIGLSDKTIYWLVKYKRNSIFHTLYQDIPYIDQEEKHKINKAKELLNQLMVKKDLHGVHELLHDLIDKTYYLEGLLLKQGGKQMVSNVYKFLEIAFEFSKTFTDSLEDFIDHIERLKETEEPQAKIQSENANVVKLMTIHKSKGLQFPVVIIPQMARGFNYQQPYALFDKNKGIGIRYDKSAGFYNSIKNSKIGMEDEENKRILYVAMTRAEKRLIVGNQGKARGFKKLIEDYLTMEDIQIIEKINSQKGTQEPVKIIDNKLFERKSFNNNLPLIKEIEGYGKRSFHSFSPSQFIDFNQCRRMFFMKYYNKLSFDLSLTIEEERTIGKINPATKGNIVHKFCEIYRHGENPISLLEQIVNSFGIEYEKELEKELIPYINNYLKNYREDYDQVYIEKDFYLTIEDIYIHGIIDRINIKDNHCEILDFKTNRVNSKKELLNIYEPQIQLYVNAFERISNIKVTKAAILFLETGEFEEVDISKESLINNYEDIKNFVQFIKKNNSIEQYEKSMKCKGQCKYSMFCNLN